MGIVSDLAREVTLPRMIRVHQHFDDSHISTSSIPLVVREQLSKPEISHAIRPGMRIAVACGSRGIANIDLILSTVVNFFKAREAIPFLFPAMGSHGGATAKGQLEILSSLGITEETMGCPILSSMDVCKIGCIPDGRPVFIDRHAYEADAIVIVGRIKPHTAFRGPYESGLMKMMVIGMGKQHGAESCHKTGFAHMARDLELFGREILARAPILCGIGIVENALDQTRKITALTPEEILSEEPKLLTEAKQAMPRIYFDPIDLLIVDQIGKNFSGDGMDPNITGNFCSPYASGGISAERRIALDLSNESHGCAVGVGTLDMISRRLYDKIDLEASYPNSITSRMVCQVKIPMVLTNDRETIQIALKTCIDGNPEYPRIVRIPNSLHLSEIEISEALLKEAQCNSMVTVLSQPYPFLFDQNGNLF